MKIINLEQNTQEWLDYRKDKFSASVTPCLFGVGYHKAYQEAYYRYGGGKRPDISCIPAVELGVEYEPKVRDFINVSLKRNFKPLVCEWEQDGRFIASLDGYDNGEILEIKVSELGLIAYKNSNEVPLRYMYQVQHQMMVSVAKKALLAIAYPKYDGTLDIELINIEPDLAMQDEIKSKWLEFEATYKNKPVDYVALMKVEELHKINEQISVLKEQKEEIENYFKERGKDEVFEINNIRLTCYTRNHTHIDYKKIVERNNCEILESDRQTKQTKTIKITEKKEIV